MTFHTIRTAAASSLVPLILLVAPAGFAFALSSGPSAPGTMSNDTTVGTVAWSVPNNAKVSDDTYTTASGSAVFVSNYLKATNFGFGIPTGARIDGIVVTVERKTDSTSVKDIGVYLVKNGTIGGTNHVSTGSAGYTACLAPVTGSDCWSTAETVVTYGNSTDLWGLSWAPDDINNALSGIVFEASRTYGTGARTISVDSITMTVYYTPPPTLTVIKHVESHYGGTKTAADFNIHVSSGSPAVDVSGSPQGGSETGTTYSSLSAGTYYVSEDSPPSGYAQTGFSGDCDVNGIVTLAPGDTKTCTVTNQDLPGSITVLKNTEGGDGTFSFSGTGIGSFDITTSGGSGNNTVGNLSAGSYSVAETVPSGWSLSDLSCVNGSTPVGERSGDGMSLTLGLGEDVTCTFADTKLPLLTLQKTVDTTGDPADPLPTADQWTLIATGPSTVSGTTGSREVTSVNVPTGAYVLSESGGPRHYAQLSGWQCSGSGGTQEGSQITLEAGADVTCSTQNTYVPPGTIVVIKNAVGGDDTFSFSSEALGPFSLTTRGGGASRSFPDLDPGTYAVSEGEQPIGWGSTAFRCDNGDTDPSAIHLASGQTVVCTFTDTKNGRIIVKKTTDPSGEEQSFAFNPGYGEPFSLSDGQQQESDYLTPGIYNVSEGTLPGGWVQTGASCDDRSDPSVIGLSAGETVTCSFANAKLPVLTIVKNTDGGTGSFDFTVDTHVPDHSAQHVTLSN
jgi:hypothetical protein